MLDRVIAGFAASSPLEILALILGVAYSILAVRRNRLCWIAGAGSSMLLAGLAASRQLPMQALLQVYYVVMSAYGFWHWSRQSGAAPIKVGFWPPRVHVAAAVVLGALAWATASYLTAETDAAWPRLDSTVTWFSLFATLLVARAKIENWIYWIVTDSVLVFLYAAQGLYFAALLFVIYIVIACVGLVEWLKQYRAATAAA
ncbi:MAG: nicotinamide riboside transporter PnuC [Steroidobacteraceae bacterium]